MQHRGPRSRPLPSLPWRRLRGRPPIRAAGANRVRGARGPRVDSREARPSTGGAILSPGGIHRRCSGQLGTASATARRPRQQRRRTPGAGQSKCPALEMGRGAGSGRVRLVGGGRRGAGGPAGGCHRVRAPGRGWFAAGIARRGHRRRRCDDRGVPGAARRPEARARARTRQGRRSERLASRRVSRAGRAPPQKPSAHRARRRDPRTHDEDRECDRHLDPERSEQGGSRARCRRSRPRRRSSSVDEIRCVRLTPC